MAVTVRKDFYGVKCICRHDYENKEIQKKLQEYQKKSYDAFEHFLTNVPDFEYKNFLDVGCGDDYVVKLASKKFKKSLGLDLYPGKEYPNVVVEDWYEMNARLVSRDPSLLETGIDAMFINHSMEHAANVYALMQQVSSLQKSGQALFVAVPDGNSPFGYAITSSTTHFSCITEGYLRTTLQRFGYNVEVERREFREGAPELWAFAIKLTDGHPLNNIEKINNE